MKTALYDYYIIDRTHRELRKKCELDLGAEYSALGLSGEERMTRRFEYLSSLEVPHIHKDEKIVLIRTVANRPDVYTEAEWTEIKKEHYIHELGYVSNLSPDYATAISKGLLAVRESANEYQVRMIDAIIDLCDRYKAEAEKMGREDIVETMVRNNRQAMRYTGLAFRLCEG